LTLLSPATEDAILTGDSKQRRQDLDPIVEGGGDQQDGIDEEVDDEDNDVDEGGGEED
jgi:hypothetical protein